MTSATNRVVARHAPRPMAYKVRVDQMASRLERSRSSIIKQAISARIAQEETHDCLTQGALADVRAGLLIDRLAVQAWTDRR